VARRFSLACVLVAMSCLSAWGAPFYDSFATDTTGNYTKFDFYNASATSAMTWDSGGFVRLDSPSPSTGGATAEVFYPTGATRTPYEAVSLTVDSLTTGGSSGNAWRGAGLMISSSTSPDIFGSGSNDLLYRFFMSRESGTGDTYWLEVRSAANTTLFPVPAPGTLVDDPVTLSIRRDGDFYAFYADGTEVFRDHAVARYGASGAALPYFGIITAASGPGTTLSSLVDNLHVNVPAGPRPPLPYSSPYWLDDFTSLDGYAEKRLYPDGNGTGGPGTPITWSASSGALQASHGTADSDMGDILWRSGETIVGNARLEMRVASYTNTGSWWVSGLVLSDSDEYRSAYGTAKAVHNAYELEVINGTVQVRKLIDGVSDNSSAIILGTQVPGLDNNHSAPFYLDIVRQGDQYLFYYDSDAEGPVLPQLLATDTWNVDLKFFGVLHGSNLGVTSTFLVDRLAYYVPEPSAAALFGLGLAVLGAVRTRRGRRG
jgi:hypothetical protein